MRRKQQPTEHSCGQACVAMLTGIPVKEIIELFDHASYSKTVEVVTALRLYGKSCPDKLVRYSKDTVLPRTAIILVRYNDIVMHSGRMKECSCAHFFVMHKGKYYDSGDSDRTGLQKGERITAFLPVEGVE